MVRGLLALALLTLVSFSAHARYEFFDQVVDLPYETWLGQYYIKAGADRTRPDVDKVSLIFFTGFADTMDNHQELFKQLHQAGARVFSFDYPGQGDSQGWLSTWTMKDVASIVNSIRHNPQLNFNSNLPVILAGWSTGATMALRFAQENQTTQTSWMKEFLPDSKLAGLILLAPGVPVNMMIGGTWIFPEADTLSRHPQAIRNAPQPNNTLQGGLFTMSLFSQSEVATSENEQLPKDLPVLVMVAGDDISAEDPGDMYVDSRATKEFVRKEQSRGQPMFAYQCEHAYHGLEFEPNGIGDQTRELASLFTNVIASDPSTAKDKVSTVFQSMDKAPCPRVNGSDH